MKRIEYALWGTKNGIEDLIRVNGKEVQENLRKVHQIKEILTKKKIFQKIRIQKIDYTRYNFIKDFQKGVR